MSQESMPNFKERVSCWVFSSVIRALREVETKYRSGPAKGEMSHLSKKKVQGQGGAMGASLDKMAPH